MGTFQYYIPGAKEQQAKSAARQCGLEDVLALDDEEISTMVSDCSGGPDGGRGVIMRMREAVSYHPDEQEWVEHPTEDYWLGYDPENPPGPEDLVRRTTVALYEIPLGDGRKWKVPTAAGREDGACPLPKERGIDLETGKIERRPLQKYDQLRLYADEIREATLRDSQATVDAEREFEICMEALRANYRIGPLEASVLGLFSDDAVRLIFWTLIDLMQWPSFQEAMDEQDGEGDS